MGVKNWKLAGNNLESQIETVQRKFSLPRPIAVYFAARGIGEDQIQNFLSPRLSQLSDPYRFPGIREASQRLWNAIARREPILIHGDYDTDGITATCCIRCSL